MLQTTTLEIRHQETERDKLVEEAQYLFTKGIYTKEVFDAEVAKIRESYAQIIEEILGDEKRFKNNLEEKYARIRYTHKIL